MGVREKAGAQLTLTKLNFRPVLVENPLLSAFTDAGVFRHGQQRRIGDRNAPSTHTRHKKRTRSCTRELSAISQARQVVHSLHAFYYKIFSILGDFGGAAAQIPAGLSIVDLAIEVGLGAHGAVVDGFEFQFLARVGLGWVTGTGGQDRGDECEEEEAHVHGGSLERTDTKATRL